MKYYTAEELKVMICGKNKPERHTRKYNETRAKLENMPQEKFDELYALFYEGSSGLIGGAGYPYKLSEEDVNVINKILQNLFHTYEFISVTDLCNASKIDYFNKADSAFNECFYDRSSGEVIYEIDTKCIRRFVAEVLKSLAHQGEIEQLTIKTCGKVHIYLYRAK